MRAVADSLGWVRSAVGLWPVVLTLLMWETVAALSSSHFVPHISELAATLWTSFSADHIIEAQGGGAHGYGPHVAATALSFSTCMIVGSVIGFGAGVTASASAVARAALALILRPWHVVPPLIVIPLVFDLFGPARSTFFLAGSLYAFVGVSVVTNAALDRVSPNLISLGRLAGASRLEVAWRIRAVAILPGLVGPLKVVGSFTLGIVVVLEYLGAPMGIGRVMKFAVSYNSVALILSGVAWATLLGVMFATLIDVTAGRLLSWSGRRPRGVVFDLLVAAGARRR